MELKNYLTHHDKSSLIFDFDETLFELVLPWSNWGKDIEKDLKSIDKEIIEEYKRGNLDLNALQNAYVSKYPQTLDRLKRHNVNFETKNLSGAPTNPELISFVKNATELEFYIWTSNTRAVVEKVLKENEILSKFKKIVTRDDVKMLKPNTEGFQKIYNKEKAKTEYLFVGDSISDRVAAKDAGIDFFLVDYFS